MHRNTRVRLLLPQVGEHRFVHDLPVVELCNGLVAGALERGFDRLEVVAPHAGSVIAEIWAYQGQRRSPYFELPRSLHPRIVRRFKAMARMRRARPADAHGIIQFGAGQRKPIEIPVTMSPRADGQADVIMLLPVHHT